MKLAAIIPVKTFSKAKSRLDLSTEKKEDLCKLMFDEVLTTLSSAQKIEHIVVVSRDENALKLCKKYNTITIFDNNESGVNNAVSLADKYVEKNGFDASIVFPQDIPFMKTQDIDFLLQFQKPEKSVVVIPSRKFDGTNALLRLPVNLMETHYDEDSYKIHLSAGKACTQNTSLVFNRRIMADLDDMSDLSYMLHEKEKPSFLKKVSEIIHL